MYRMSRSDIHQLWTSQDDQTFELWWSQANFVSMQITKNIASIVLLQN